MNSFLLEKKFAVLGARAKVKEGIPVVRRNQMNTNGVRLNVLEDNKGEFFDIRINSKDVKEVAVLDVQPDDRHLLLFVRNQQGEKSKFLCGHDERHWFVAAIPETAPVGTVRQAKESLKPKEVQSRQTGLNAKKRNCRKNEAYIRQGEWFFIPEDVNPKNDLILKNEPISRGTGSKPHMCEFMYRSGGETVYVCSKYPNGVNADVYNRLIRTEGARNWGWRQMIKDAAVYVRGRISHADHATINLKNWCRVLINNENQAKSMRHVAFLD